MREGTEPAVPPGPTKARSKTLNAKALAEYKHWAKVLTAMRVFTQADVNALEAYCREWVRYVDLSEWLERAGPVRVVRGPSPGRDTAGEPIPGEIVSVEAWPQAKMVVATLDRVMKLADRLGFAPTARARMRVEPPWIGSTPGPRGVVEDPFLPPTLPSAPYVPLTTPMPPVTGEGATGGA